MDLQPGLRYYKHLLGIVSEENVREGVGVRKIDFYREREMIVKFELRGGVRNRTPKQESCEYISKKKTYERKTF